MPDSVLLAREAGVGRLIHPDPMRNAEGHDLELIVDPLTKPLTEGEPLFGWEGDNRLALYFNHQLLQWELWRLESNNQYSKTADWSLADHRAADVIPVIIKFLVAHDGRRGYNVHEDILTRYQRLQAQADKLHAEQVAEAAEHVAWGLRKDLK